MCRTLYFCSKPGVTHPATVLDVVCHEIGHAVTKWVLNDLEYSPRSESAAISEAYADIVGRKFTPDCPPPPTGRICSPPPGPTDHLHLLAVVSPAIYSNTPWLHHFYYLFICFIFISFHYLTIHAFIVILQSVGHWILPETPWH